MKRILFCVALGALCIFTLAAGGQGDSAAAEKKTEISIACHFQADSTEFRAVEYFQKLVEDRSKGQITIKTFPGSSLGSEMENLEQVKTNTVTMSVFGDLLTSQLAPEIDCTVVPFIFPNLDEVYAAWNGPLGDKIKNAIETKGNQYLIGLQKRGARQLTASKAVRTPADLAGIKLRVPEIPSWVAVWRGLGALPTPVAWAETYNALQTRVVDAQENPYMNIVMAKIYEVNKFVMTTEHLWNVYHWTINKNVMDGFSADTRKMILDAAKEACDWGDKQVDAKTAENVALLKANGVQIIEVDKQIFINAARPHVEKLAESWDPAARELIKKFYR